MEIKEGMYVRTKYNGILKTEEIYKQNGEYVIAIYNKVGTFVDITEIIGEPSFDIKDLIQVGDYVNGKNVIETYYKSDEKWHLEIVDARLITHDELKHVNIQSIVTKEQFEQMEYKL